MEGSFLLDISSQISKHTSTPSELDSSFRGGRVHSGKFVEFLLSPFCDEGCCVSTCAVESVPTVASNVSGTEHVTRVDGQSCSFCQRAHAACSSPRSYE